MYKDFLHITYDDLTIKYNGKEIYMLSKALLDRQNCWDNLDEIKEIHWFKLVIFELIAETKSVSLLRSLAQDLTEIEYKLQELWGFKLDANYHRFWDVPKCRCPILDNCDRYPFGGVISTTCPLHGVR